MTSREIKVHLRRPHPKQHEFIASKAKRRILRAGRRHGKTVGMGILAVRAFLAGRRVLYAVPTSDQLQRFWFEVKHALRDLIDAGIVVKNETDHTLTLPGTLQRIRGKTAWNADTLRGDFADLLILDEFQLMNEDAWEVVGAPMMLDTNGDAVFVYTPPSARTRSISKANDKMHAAKLWKKHENDPTGRWACFHFTSHDNPYLSREALAEISSDMTARSIRQEILAEDLDDAPGALWKRDLIEAGRVERCPELARVVVAIDPAVTSTATSDECGLVVAGIGQDGHGYILTDQTARRSPAEWGAEAVRLYHAHAADRIIAETNNGGDMVELTIRTVPAREPYPSGAACAYRAVTASRGKAVRAEPVAALYEQGKVHHVGCMPDLEDELCTWEPLGGMRSPNRLDALVWALTDLMLDRSSFSVELI